MTKDADRSKGKLDINGRCCGRKPMVYKSGTWTPLQRPHRFCPRCGASFEIGSDRRIEESGKR